MRRPACRIRSTVLLLTLVTCALSPALPAAVAQTTASSSAFGEHVELTLLPLLGGPIAIESGPLPLESGQAPPAYGLENEVLSVLVNGPLGLGRLLSTGVLTTDARSSVPGADEVAADAQVDGLEIGVLGLLTLEADTVSSHAEISSTGGDCGSGFEATGSAVLESATLGGLLIPGGITIPLNPPPNHVLLNLPGVLRIVLNEQTVTDSSIAVNAIRVTLNVSPVGIGTLSGDIMVAHSEAKLDCVPVGTPPPPPPPEDEADLDLTVVTFPSPVEVGQPWTTRWTLTNHGPAPAPGVMLEITPPSGASVVSVEPGCQELDDLISCDLGTLAAGAAAEVTVVLRPPSTGLVVISGQGTSDLPDPDPSDDTASAAVQVVQISGSTPRAVGCKVGAVPAATLLIPFFEVDLDDASGRTTLFSITNARAQSTLAQVTLWTDRAVPTLSFPVYLTGFDVQSFNLRDLFTSGRLPDTGPAVSPHGTLSDGAVPFPGCDGALPTVLGASEVTELRALHTGRPSPTSGLCAASPREDPSMATGYITVDAVQRCSDLTPGLPSYFDDGPDAVLAFDNTLLGDVFRVDPGSGFAQGDPAVHLEADPDRFDGRTFYGSISGGRDHRQPLGTLYGIRFLSGAGFSAGTRLSIWRATPPAAPAVCGSELGTRLVQRPPLAFDEEENAFEVTPGAAALSSALQEIELGGEELPVSEGAGWLLLDLGTEFPSPGQAWVNGLISAEGLYSVGYAAAQLDDPCSP